MSHEGTPDEQAIREAKIRERLDRIGRKIIVMSGKGGVGKTTVTVNLANALVDAGKTVGILDTDLHGPNVAKMLGCESGALESADGNNFLPVKVRDGLYVVSLSFALNSSSDPVIWRGPMKIAVIKQFLGDVEWGNLDYLLIDSPPGTGDEQLTAIQAIPEMTGSIIVTTPQDVAILDARKSVNFSRKLNVAVLGVIENMSGLICPDCGKEIPIFGKGGGKKMCDEMDTPYLGSVPLEMHLREFEDAGQSTLSNSPDSKSSKAIRDIAAFLDDRIQISNVTTDYKNTSKCSPSSCASCSSNCSSRKEN
ncbi:MAG: Mrp/NBP35 family ATP-binding protein [Pleomorphochaeta sp.]